MSVCTFARTWVYVRTCVCGWLCLGLCVCVGEWMCRCVHVLRVGIEICTCVCAHASKCGCVVSNITLCADTYRGPWGVTSKLISLPHCVSYFLDPTPLCPHPIPRIPEALKWRHRLYKESLRRQFALWGLCSRFSYSLSVGIRDRNHWSPRNCRPLPWLQWSM